MTCLLCVIAMALRVQASGEPSGFHAISTSMAVANQEMAAQLRQQLWPSATRAWEPKDEQVLDGLRFLKTVGGTKEIIGMAPRQTDMRPCIAAISQTRFQVYGFVIKNQKHLLYDSAPDISVPHHGFHDPWLKESISGRVYDGGATFWFVLYNCETGRVVACGRRPD